MFELDDFFKNIDTTSKEGQSFLNVVQKGMHASLTDIASLAHELGLQVVLQTRKLEDEKKSDDQAN